jgi:riboflavin synthase
LALQAQDRLGGHLVSGHVDGMATLVARRPDARAERLEFEVPGPLARYLARKGSVCLDGVSLTVNDVEGCRFGVCLIPHTLAVTTLGALQPGERVNLEVDLVARYLERLAAPFLESSAAAAAGAPPDPSHAD